MHSATFCPISAEENLDPGPEAVFAAFDRLGIPFVKYDHAPIFTVAEGLDIERGIPGAHCRNLFLRDKKENMFLVTAMNETRIDLKKLAASLGASGRFSFGSPERLFSYLRVRPGSVCPFSVMHDTGGAVRLVLDAQMMRQDKVNYHPLLNTMTVTLAPKDLLTFTRAFGHEPLILEMGDLAPDA